jgi:hypothetical protein
MHKPISFAITAVVLLAAIVTVSLYTLNAANAQGNTTSGGGAAKNMTGGAAKNMTGAAAGSLKSAIGGKCPKC